MSLEQLLSNVVFTDDDTELMINILDQLKNINNCLEQSEQICKYTHRKLDNLLKSTNKVNKSLSTSIKALLNNYTVDDTSLTSEDRTWWTIYNWKNFH